MTFAPELRGRFSTIVVDLPWPNDKIKRQAYNWPGDDVTEYQTMSLVECAAFPFEELASPTGAHVWFWSKVKLLPLAHRIIQEHGVRFMFEQVWRKLVGTKGCTDGPKPFGMPKYDMEPCLYGRIGNPGGFLDTKRFRLVLDGKRREHSRKPEEFYEQVIRVCPAERIDVFSREERCGWTAWGLEAGKFGGGVMIEFFVEGHPKTKGSTKRKKVAGQWRTVNDCDAEAAWAEEVKTEAWCHRPPSPFDGAVQVDITFLMPRPARLKGLDVLHTVRPDRDKLLRSIQDALSGVMYRDDAQVAKGSTVKLYANPGQPAGVHVLIQHVEVVP